MLSTGKSPRLFRRMFRSTEDMRSPGRSTPLFPRRKKVAKIFPQDDMIAEGIDLQFAGSLIIEEEDKRKSAEAIIRRAHSVDENGEPCYHTRTRTVSENIHNQILNEMAEIAAATSPKKKILSYSRFTRKYKNKHKCNDDDEFYKKRSRDIKDSNAAY